MSFFKRGSEDEKIGQKCEKTKLFRFLASGLRWSPGSWGKERKGKERGKNTSDRIARKNVEIGQLRLDRASWKCVRHAVGTPLVAGGLKTPGGGTPPATHSVSTSPIVARTRKHRHSRQTSCGSARSRPLFGCEWPNDAGQVGGEVFATQKKLSGIVCDVQNLRKSGLDFPKSRPGASKIEPGGLQDVIF